MKNIIRWVETPKCKAKECRHWDEHNKRCKLEQCRYKAKR